MEQRPTVAANVLLPPSVTNIKAPLSKPQQLRSNSSATGNPRNKCALKPGYGLMGWIRLENSGQDLAGTGGKVLQVTKEELAKHNTVNDAWMAIRGKVYNVTRYMDYHPGGVDELMRGVGKDATKLFDEVHAFVNYSKLLAKCYVGPLKYIVDDKKAITKLNNEISNKLPPLYPVISEIQPKFDWIQTSSSLTFFIYTKQLCNPGLFLHYKDSKSLIIRIQIEQVFHEFSIDTVEDINWPPSKANVATESGKIEISFKKSNDGLWTHYGSQSLKRLTANDHLDEMKIKYEIIGKRILNHDSFEMSVQSQEKIILLPPVGYHVTIQDFIEGSEISRSYTPVPGRYLNSLTLDPNNVGLSSLHFLIKFYENGVLSSSLNKKEISSLLHLTLPQGNFNLSLLTKHRNILFLAAGSGITPFLSLIEPLLRRATNRLDYLKLLYFNKTAEDIWCRHILESQQDKDERFQFKAILSQDSPDWTGLTGRLNKDLLSSYIASKEQPNESTFVAICGPNAFNQLAVDILKSLNFNEQNYHVFH